MKRRRYYFWPIMLVLVSVFCWSYFQPRKQSVSVTVNRSCGVPYQYQAHWDPARGDPNDIQWPKRIIKEDKPPSIRVEVYRDGKWIEVLPAK
jgi:hypothetical protein